MNAFVRLIAALAALLALTACGGGMQAGVGSGGSGAPMSVGVGPVTGFGSVIVNGQRYDESTAQVLVEDRPDRTMAATVAAIRLGMRVELQHRAFVVSTATIAAEVIGPVSSVSATSFVAVGQTVRVNADPARPTVFDGFGALSDLAGGAIVEVHGDRAANDEILATRVELKPAGLALVRVAGTASNVAGRSFSIGALAVDGSAATFVPAGAALANGQRVVAWTDVAYAGGPLAAKIVRIGALPIADSAAVTVDGPVASFQSVANFRVGGVPVDASNATFVGGTAAQLANGREVRVRGTSVNGVLRASDVEFLQNVQEVQLTGAITGFVDAGTAFRIRNAVARVTPQTTYVNGSASNLGSGVAVRLSGVLSDGVVQAVRVEFLPPGQAAQSVVHGQIVGPVSAVATDGSRTFRVDALASEVKATSATSYKNGVAADIAVGRQVKVKGRLDGAQFVADEIQFMDSQGAPPTFEIEGIAGKVQATSVVVNGQTVQLTSTTIYTVNGAAATQAALRNGLEVQIVAARVAGVVTALSVDIEAAAPGGGMLRVRGIVSGRTPPNATQFLVGQQRVDVAGNPQVVPGNKTLADVVNGSDVEARGTLASGVLNATRIHIR
jgi:hypothetical protein